MWRPQFFEVATWAVLVGQKGRRDLCPRPGRYVHDLHTLSARTALAVRTTCPRPACCARDMRATSSLCARHARDQLTVCATAPTTWALRTQCARDLGSGCAHCAPDPILDSMHCSGHCLDTVSWTLFMSTVHRVKKKSTKNFKIFLGVI